MIVASIRRACHFARLDKAFRRLAHAQAFHAVAALQVLKMSKDLLQESEVGECIYSKIVRMPPEMIELSFLGRES
jgi:hypothetical protein